MIIYRDDLRDGSCNFCSKGILNEDGTGIVYSYREVTVIESDGNGMCARLCDECLRQLRSA